MERKIYLTEEELSNIVDEAVMDTIKNTLNNVGQAAKQTFNNRSSEFKQGWDAYKNAQRSGQSGFNAIKRGVNAANQANYNNRTYDANGAIKKPGFFDGTFTAIANNFTGGKWSKVRNGIAKHNIQKAYSNPNNNGLNKYEQRLFDFWTQNVKGQFRDSRDETAGQTAVRMWNEWYETQTNSTINNKALDEYIDTCIQTGKKVSQMSYPDFLGFCKLNSYNSQDYQQNESLQRLLRKNLMQLI